MSAGQGTRWQEIKELGCVEAMLGTTVTAASDSGAWLDFSGCENLRISISGTINTGAYDVLCCEWITKPPDTDNAHPSLLQGLSGSALNELFFAVAPHWVKFITNGAFTGTLNCGATADRKNAWRR
jgi:hypothetical protein